MPDPMEQTAVYKWLKDNDAEEFAKVFYDDGYYDDVDLIDQKYIDEHVTKPDIASTLKASLDQRLADNKAQEEKKKAGPMEPPKLPPGFTLDLSAPSIPTGTGITFSVPTALSVQATQAAIVDPDQLTQEQWMVVARGTNLLYAYRIGGDKPELAETPILDWQVPMSLDFVQSATMSASVTSKLTYSEETASYVESGFDTETASLGVPYCAASFEC
jgi:hypothetical protein